MTIMQGVHPNDSNILADSGFNLLAVFDLDTLPLTIRQSIKAIAPEADYRQLLLFGHGGRRMWQALAASAGITGENPLDDFSVDVVARYFSDENPANRYRLIYPQHPGMLPLQQLGRLAGWHHDSPFRIGVNDRWGSWFAYRAVALADTAFVPSLPMVDASPCEACVSKPCISACPVVSGNEILLDNCLDERLGDGSSCARSCLARMACPVKTEHRYGPEQMAYHYDCSLVTIRRYRTHEA